MLILASAWILLHPSGGIGPTDGAHARFMDKKSLFLVEDNQDNADLIRDLIGDDYHLSCFPDGPSALSALIEENGRVPDLLLLDISLPGMDGATLLRQIRSHARLKHIPALALTAHAMKSDRENLIAAGFNAYVSKPITDDRLLTDAIEAYTSHPICAAA
jgi:two-component system cell cycle response regulator DivK